MRSHRTVLAIVTFAAATSAQSTTPIAPGSSPAFSADERYVAYTSVPGPGGVAQIRLLDRQAWSWELISVSSAGTQGNGASDHASVSADGRFVAFDSLASNLVVGDTNGVVDVFVRDRVAGTTTRVSMSYSGAQAMGENPSISGDGRFVAFESIASNIVSPPALGHRNIYVHDRLTGQTTRASFDLPPLPSNGEHFDPQISTDGAWVVYASTPWGGGWTQLNRTELATGFVDPVTVDGVGPTANRRNELPSISADGRHVAFASIDPSVSGHTLAYVTDTSLDTFEVVSVAPSGQPAFGGVQATAISADGLRVAFTSNAADLNGGTPAARAYLRDRVLGSTTLLSVDQNGAAVSVMMTDLALSASGRFAVFHEQPSNAPLYLRDTLACPDVTAYCTAGTTTHGCVPSIQATGVASATATSGFTLTISNVEGQRTGLIFYGLAPAAQPWGLGSSSYLCVLYPVQRTGAQVSGGTAGACDGTLAIDWNAWRAANPGGLGSPFVAGDQFYAQGWFRDGGAVKGTNLSGGVRFTVCD
jgi:Tol biopolymer transport system component